MASRAVRVLLSALCQAPGVVLAADSTQDPARANATDAVQTMIDAADPDTVGENDEFALVDAVVRGDVEEAERLHAESPHYAPPLMRERAISPDFVRTFIDGNVNSPCRQTALSLLAAMRRADDGADLSLTGRERQVRINNTKR